MRCPACKAYVSEGVNFDLCPKCGVSLEADPFGKAPPHVEDCEPSEDMNVDDSEEVAPPLRLSGIRSLFGVLATNQIRIAVSFLLMVSLFGVVYSLHVRLPALAGYVLDALAVTGSLFFYFRFRVWFGRKHAIWICLSLAVLSCLLAYSLRRDALMLFPKNGTFYINRGKADHVAIDNQFVVLGDPFEGSSGEREEVGLVRVIRLQRQVAEVELMDFRDAQGIAQKSWSVKPYDANLPARRFIYGQIIEYDGTEAIVNLGVRSGLAVGDRLTVLGEPVTDLSYPGRSIGRRSKGYLQVLRAKPAFVEAVPIAEGRAALSNGDFVVREDGSTLPSADSPSNHTLVDSSPAATRPAARRTPESSEVTELLAFGRHQEIVKATLSITPGFVDMRYGFTGSELEATTPASASKSTNHLGHIINLGHDVRFESVQLNTDRSYSGRMFEGIGRDPAHFIRHTFCLLGEPQHIVQAAGVLTCSVSPRQDDVLLVRSLHMLPPHGFRDTLFKVKVEEHTPGATIRLRWALLFRREASPFRAWAICRTAVRGRTTDKATGDGIGSAIVRILDADGNLLAPVETDDDGVFYASFDHQGKIKLNLSADGYSSFQDVFTVLHEKENDLGDIPLQKTATLEELGIHGNAILFVIDTSGSMRDYLDSVKAQLTSILKTLPGDRRFNVVFFSDDAAVWSQHMELATAEAVESACDFASRAEANGGTEIASALRACATVPYANTIYILSDGEFTQRDAAAREIVRELSKHYGEPVTVSSVSYGTEESAGVLRSLDIHGLGKHHHVERFQRDWPRSR